MLVRKVFRQLCMIIGLYCPIIAYAQAAELSQTASSSQTAALSAAITTDDNRQLHVNTLAASCAACHGTLGNNAQQAKLASAKMVQLAGINPTEFIQAMQAFKSGTRTATVMHHHAKGLTMQEITDLAVFFSGQVVRKPTILRTQKLLKDHAN
jgi:sulfide dehydrogenase cytochrome subunit